MALRHIPRRRAPIDGTWFRTEARLNGILRAKSGYDDNVDWPKFVNDTTVPLFVRMEKYEAQETTKNPSGMIFGPVVRIGSMDSVEVEMFGHHYNAGLYRDHSLDTYFDDREDMWLYTVVDGDKDAPGEDVSAYECSKCGKWLYKDDYGRRSDKSACMVNGELVCRDCDFTGLVYDEDTKDQISRCRKLASFLDEMFDRRIVTDRDNCRVRFEQNIAHISQGFCGSRPSQTRLFKEDKFSFAWNTVIFMEDGSKKRGINGGLIQHGPTPTIALDGSYQFKTWDYTEKKERDATPEEVGNITWSIHT